MSYSQLWAKSRVSMDLNLLFRIKIKRLIFLKIKSNQIKSFATALVLPSVLLLLLESQSLARTSIWHLMEGYYLEKWFVAAPYMYFAGLFHPAIDIQIVDHNSVKATR